MVEAMQPYFGILLEGGLGLLLGLANGVLLFVLARENFADAVEVVNFSDGLVWAKAGNAGKAEGEAAVVTIRTLDVVERNFQDDLRIDGADLAAVLDGVGQEIVG